MSGTQLDKTFHFIINRMVETGQAPFYTEIAQSLGISPVFMRVFPQTGGSGLFLKQD
ncbi:MAG TPA: hypothetical protein HPQ03_01225 [Deltaproteobacteria bacterium]|nr:hypothetical protein [Deltaproteobacteria bacterium]